MSRFNHVVRKLLIVKQSLEQQATRLRLPAFLRFDRRTGATVPEDQEAEEQARSLGITLKEYIIDDGWNPDDEGIDDRPSGENDLTFREWETYPPSIPTD